MLSFVITRFISAALIATITISQNFAAEPSKSAEKNAAHNHQIKSQQFYVNFQEKLKKRNDTYNPSSGLTGISTS